MISFIRKTYRRWQMKRKLKQLRNRLSSIGLDTHHLSDRELSVVAIAINRAMQKADITVEEAVQALDERTFREIFEICLDKRPYNEKTPPVGGVR